LLPEDRTSTVASTQVDRVLWLYSLLVVLTTLGAWAFYLANGGQSDTRPLFVAYDQFHDLTNYVGKVSHLRGSAAALGSGVPIFTYPAPAAFVYKLLLRSFAARGVWNYLIFLGLCAVAYALAALRASKAYGPGRISATVAILTTAFLGYPLWMVADRANIEGVVWAFSAAGVCFLLRGRYWAAAILIGIAASIKPFPGLFFLLLLRLGKVKETVLGVAVTAAITVGALSILGPNPWQAYQDLKPGVAEYMARYIDNLTPVEEERFSHSILDGMKSAALTVEIHGFIPKLARTEIPRLIAEPGGWDVVHPLVRIYPFIAAVGFALVVAVFYRAPLLNQLTALAVSVTLFPLSAADYTLLHLLVPFAGFVAYLTHAANAGRAVYSQASMLALATIYAMLFAPLTFLRIYAGDAKLLLLLALLFVAARTPMRSAYFGDSHTAGAITN
jgi:hypothetical protein